MRPCSINAWFRGWLERQDFSSWKIWLIFWLPRVMKFLIALSIAHVSNKWFLKLSIQLRKDKIARIRWTLTTSWSPFGKVSSWGSSQTTSRQILLSSSIRRWIITPSSSSPSISKRLQISWSTRSTLLSWTSWRRQRRNGLYTAEKSVKI